MGVYRTYRHGPFGKQISYRAQRPQQHPVCSPNLARDDLRMNYTQVDIRQSRKPYSTHDFATHTRSSLYQYRASQLPNRFWPDSDADVDAMKRTGLRHGPPGVTRRVEKLGMTKRTSAEWHEMEIAVPPKVRDRTMSTSMLVTLFTANPTLNCKAPLEDSGIKGRTRKKADVAE